MNRYLFIGFLFGALFSSAIYALDKADNILYVNGNDIKIEIRNMDDGFIKGVILVKVDGSWHQFENSTYSRQVELSN